MLKNLLDKYSIILASGSPRRQQFLEELKIPFSIKFFDIEEIYPPQLIREEITNYLAELKAKPFDTILKEDELIIASDTVVWFKNKALGKPKNHQESFDMLSALSGNSHEVISSICFKTKRATKTIHDCTKVYFKNLTSDEINFYIDNYKPFDKAGSYGIQEWIGYIGVEKIEGNYSNVMGFPLSKLYEFLKNEVNNPR
ncbi:Maf family nucleotide pyrophosphatase [Flavicella sp.]|uniref:Maf family nucleotide pyrophosphatase n=1 Tax=Flavicella sp. TaxID=2957742 RepID=UPI003019CDC5